MESVRGSRTVARASMECFLSSSAESEGEDRYRHPEVQSNQG